MGCDCEYCLRYRRTQEILEGNDLQKIKDLCLELSDLLAHAEAELNHDEAILDGSWPSSQEILERSLSKARLIRSQQ